MNETGGDGAKEGIQTLFAAALEQPPDERAAFLAASGHEPAVIAEVESLLQAHEGRGRLDSILGRLQTFSPTVSSASTEEIAGRLRASVGERYRIVRELGRGGMAIVFLAEDPRHHRQVALKVLKPELAHDIGISRFLQEIETVAGLAHPNILPLHDSGEANGLLYYVMPYVSGESLRERLIHVGRNNERLPVAEAVRIAREVADALYHAHERGIVHCDIKPENILLVSGHAVVSDFGIARAMKVAGAEDLAEAAVAFGTPTYMSPEQIRAEVNVDGRSDIYSLGCMLYEMLEGKAPFRGSVPSVLHQHLFSRPAPVQGPPALVEAVSRAMAKGAASRFASAAEFERALAGIAADADAHRQSSASSRRRAAIGVTTLAAVVVGVIAMLVQSRRGDAVPRTGGPVVVAIRPFVQLGAPGSAGFGWLAAALETRLAYALFDAPDIDLRSTTAVLAYGERQIPDDSLARLLDVDFFLDGQIIPSGDSITVTVQLSDGPNATVLEVGSVRQALSAPSEQLLEAVASKVTVTLLPAVGREVRVRQWRALAHDTQTVMLRHRAQERRWAGEALLYTDPRAAAREFAAADSLLAASASRDRRWQEPRLARASLAARRALAERTFSDTAVIRQILDDGIASAESVLEEDGESAEALAYRGRLKWRKYLWAGREDESQASLLDAAESDLRRAASAVRPVAAAAQDLSEILYMVRARFAEAREFALQAYRLDAYLDEAGLLINRIALTSLNLGYDSDAANWCRTGLRRYPDQPFHVACLLEVMAWGTGPVAADSARAYYRALTAREPHPTVRWHYMLRVAAVHARAGQRREAEQLLAQVRNEVRQAGANGSLLLPWEAGVHFRLGNAREGERLYAQYRAYAPDDAAVRANGFPLRGFVAPGPGGPSDPAR